STQSKTAARPELLTKEQATQITADLKEALAIIAKTRGLVQLRITGNTYYPEDGRVTLKVEGVINGGRDDATLAREKASAEYDYTRSRQKEFPARGTHFTNPRDGKEYVIAGLKRGRSGRFALHVTALAGKEWVLKMPPPQR